MLRTVLLTMLLTAIAPMTLAGCGKKCHAGECHPHEEPDAGPPPADAGPDEQDAGP